MDWWHVFFAGTVKRVITKQVKPENMENNNTKDPHRDAPSVGREDKHINFREEGEKAGNSGGGADLRNQEDEQRRNKTNEGIEEGRPFEKRELNEDETY